MWSHLEAKLLNRKEEWHTLYSVSGNVECQFTQQTSTCLSFSVGKEFCCWSSVPPFNLKLLSFLLPTLFQTPEDPASREILCCHGHQADPPNTAADLYIYNAFQCLRLIQTRACMCTHKDVHSLPVSPIQNLNIYSASSKRWLTQRRVLMWWASFCVWLVRAVSVDWPLSLPEGDRQLCLLFYKIFHSVSVTEFSNV